VTAHPLKKTNTIWVQSRKIDREVSSDLDLMRRESKGGPFQRKERSIFQLGNATGGEGTPEGVHDTQVQINILSSVTEERGEGTGRRSKL